MVRVATIDDAVQLEILNNEFNGDGETSLENIKNSLLSNKQEIVIVYDNGCELVGFCCIQLKKSFCYDNYMPEITEVYVKPNHRKEGVATKIIQFAEDYCKTRIDCHKFELLTGKDNDVAQSVYGKLGYTDDGEIHLSKRIK